MASPILMPKQGNSVESCLIVSWKKQKGDTISIGDVLCEVETDKAVMDVESTASGVLLETFFAEGEDVPVQTVIAVVGNPGDDVTAFLNDGKGVGEKGSRGEKEQGRENTSLTSQDLSSFQTTKSTSTISSQQEFLGVSPRAKKLASEKSIAVANIQGTGPSGRILERDIIAAINTHPIVQKTEPATTYHLSPTTYEAVPLQGVRKRIAERMLASLQTTAQLTLNSWADARELLETRATIKKNAEKFSLPNITINDLVLFAVSKTLLQYPELNATFENDTIYKHKNVHLGFAVDTPRGLLVPVMKNTQQLKLPALALSAKQLAYEALEARIAPDALQGATFTVSNLGNFGIEHFTPVLNPPQVAILGVGTIVPKTILKDEAMETYPHIALSLTVNHQVVDGAPAAKFLQTLSQNIANISGLLIS